MHCLKKYEIKEHGMLYLAVKKSECVQSCLQCDIYVLGGAMSAYFIYFHLYHSVWGASIKYVAGEGGWGLAK